MIPVRNFRPRYPSYSPRTKISPLQVSHIIRGDRATYSTHQSHPQPSITRFIYPLVLFSLLTTFTINLKSNKLETDSKIHKLNGQISVLENIRTSLIDRDLSKITNDERINLLRSIRHDLELVGLKPRSVGYHHHYHKPQTGTVSWREVLMGRDGVEVVDDSDKEYKEIIQGLIESEKK